MKKNVLSVDFHISQYGKIVEELRKEVSCSVLCWLVQITVKEGPLTAGNISGLNMGLAWDTTFTFSCSGTDVGRTQLGSRVAEYGLHSTVCNLPSGTQSCMSGSIADR